MWTTKFGSLSLPDSHSQFSLVVRRCSDEDHDSAKGFLAPSLFPRQHPPDNPTNIVVRSSRMSRRFVLAGKSPRLQLQLRPRDNPRFSSRDDSLLRVQHDNTLSVYPHPGHMSGNPAK